MIELDDVLRDALSDLLSSETQYGPVVDGQGACAGVLSVEIIAHFLHTAPKEARSGADRSTRRRTRRWRRPLSREPSRRLRSRRSRSRHERATAAGARTASARTGSSTTSTATSTPLLEHVYLTVVSVAFGFAIAFALALIAHRRRWLIGPIVGVTGVALHAAEPRGLLPAAADHRPRHDDGDRSRSTAYTLQIIFRNIIDRPRQRPRRGEGRRRAAWG